MSECHFCQDVVKKENDFIVSTPEGNELHVCKDCMTDVNSYLSSAKRDKIQTQSEILDIPIYNGKSIRLVVVSSQGFLGLADDNDKLVKVFHNVRINRCMMPSFKINTPYPGYEHWMNEPYPENSVQVDMTITDRRNICI